MHSATHRQRQFGGALLIDLSNDFDCLNRELLIAKLLAECIAVDP